MGIRYYAWAISDEFAEAARADPREFLRDDPFCCCNYDGEAPATLDLDKAWRYLQGILGGDEAVEARPAFELVRGQVTNTCCGWRSFYRYLTPDEIRAAALDLATVDECEVMEALAVNRVLPDDRYSEDVDYVLRHLHEAVTFTSDLASRGLGLVYVIG